MVNVIGLGFTWVFSLKSLYVLTISYPSNADLPENDVVVTGLKTTFLYVQDY